MNAGEDLKNKFRAARKPGPNDRVIELNKPLGIVLEEDEKGNVYVKDLTPGGNAARVRLCLCAGVGKCRVWGWVRGRCK